VVAASVRRVNLTQRRRGPRRFAVCAGGRHGKRKEQAPAALVLSGRGYAELPLYGVLRSSFPLGMSSVYSAISSNRVERAFPNFEACITIALWGRAGHLLPPSEERRPGLLHASIHRSAWRDWLIIPIDPIMDSRKRPQRDQKRRLADFRAAERGRSWVL
jgi:hypothetical protein